MPGIVCKVFPIGRGKIGIEPHLLEKVFAIHQYAHQSLIRQSPDLFFLCTLLLAADHLPDWLFHPQVHCFGAFLADEFIQGVKQIVLDISVALAEVYIQDVRSYAARNSQQRTRIQIHALNLDAGKGSELDLGVLLPESLYHRHICFAISISMPGIGKLKDFQHHPLGISPRQPTNQADQYRQSQDQALSHRF